MNLDVMFSSKSMEWATPQDFFDRLNEEFHFTLDPAADDFNHKCDLYYTEEQNGLAQNWGGKLSSATHHMADASEIGSRNVRKRQSGLIQLASC